MEEWIIILLFCALYLLISLAMGIIPGLNISSSVTGFVAGDRKMNLLILYFVLGASNSFSSFAFLGGPGWAYSRGAAAFYIIAYGTTGIIPYYFLDPNRAGSERSMALLPRPNCWKIALTAAHCP
ncbi:MAG: hypothetical protein U5K69_24965 [Balneolaceae bacterium]|nr:hypothetical protein [Balneolaceae bacterium]